MKQTSQIAALTAAALLAGGCSNFFTPAWYEQGVSPARSSSSAPVEEERRAPAAPAPPVDAEGRKAFEQASRAKGKRVLISLQDRWLWLIEGEDTVLAAPVAVGMNKGFEFRGKSWFFETPQGAHRVLGKAEDPKWVPPEWHYYEIAKERDLEPVFLRKGQRVALEDGTRIEVRGDQVGRVNSYGNFWPFTPGKEIIFDGKVFIPPIGTAQREVPLTLGTHKLELGDGYLIHGTDQPDSVGSPVSHGCVRMRNEDVSRLYAMVPVGTPVYIY